MANPSPSAPIFTVTKVTHTFVFEKDEKLDHPYALTHGLGKDVIVSVRKADGSVKKVSTLAQDDSILIVTPDTPWVDGDTIIVIG